MKNIFTKIFAAVIFLSFLILRNTFAQEGGYSDKYSVAQGDSITFYISSTTATNTITIFKIQDIARFQKTISNVNFKFQAVPDSAFWYGCGWKPTLTLKIDSSWSPGIYRADFKTKHDSATNGILFFVKPKILSSTSKILLVIATNTWQAYNTYGGLSFYQTQSPSKKRSYKLSFNRSAAPPLGTLGSADFYKYERKFINWAYLNNINLEYASMYDLDNDPNFLSNYKVVLVVGHNEYWSRDERRQFENYIHDGGKVMILSGNTCWWQVRFEDNGQTLVCYKDKNFDPLTGVQDSLVTVNWWAPPVNYPENIFTGVNFKDGGYVNSGYKLPKSQGFGDYTAFNTHYWIFDGTGLNEGDEFGYKNAIVGYETDGTPTGWDAKGLGVPINTAQSQTPDNFRIFGFSPTRSYDTTTVAYGHATMGMYYAQNTNKGAVFNAATTDWADGLLNDPDIPQTPDSIVERITLNVLNKFLQNRFPPEILSWSPYQDYSVYRNADPVHLSIRDTVVVPGDSIQLSFTAQNPFPSLQTTLNYFWKADGVGKGIAVNSYTFKNTESSVSKKRFVVTGFAYNNEDTAYISWNIFDYPLVVFSLPTNAVKPGTNYYYQVKAYNNFQDTLSYKLVNSPVWMNINPTTGLIQGIAPQTEGDTTVTIKVVDNHANSDTQTFTLHISNTITSVRENNILPSEFSLYQNYPNPFNPSTTINYEIPKQSFVKLKIYDILGREVKTLVNEEKSAGNYKVTFDASGLASGIYFYRMQAGSFVETKKLILLK